MLLGVVATSVAPHLRACRLSSLFLIPSSGGRHSTAGRRVGVSMKAEADESVDKDRNIPEGTEDAPILIGTSTDHHFVTRALKTCFEKHPTVVTFSAGLGARYAGMKAACNVVGSPAEGSNEGVVVRSSKKELEGGNVTFVRYHEMKAFEVQPGEDVLIVGRTTNAGKLAGAVQKRIALNGQVKINGRGPEAMAKAETAILLAMKYFENDGEPTTLVYKPQFVEKKMRGTMTRMMELVVGKE